MFNSIAIPLILINERTRELDPAHRDELASDILRNGLLQPIILGDSPDSPPLVDGLHRLRAIEALHASGEIIFYDGEPLFVGQVPFIRFGDLSPARLLEAEIAANLFRRDLTWQERTDALARLHRAQLELDPNATVSSTAAKLAGATGKSESTLQKAIARATVIADAIEADPSLASARSETEAMSRVKSDITRLASGLLEGGFSTTNSLHTLIAGDATAILPNLGAETVDLILSDPPYGVGADTWTSKFQDAPHHYKDDWKSAEKLYGTILLEGSRLGKERSNIFLFCAVERWHLIRDMADGLGWSVWPRPIIWHKSNEGIRPWGQKGYAYCYEAILFACKGQRGLYRTGSDVISGIYKVRDREHGATKPASLFGQLITSACLPGDTVLDPCCGSGTIFEAATLTSTIATGIEKDEHYIGLSRQRLELTKEDLTVEELDTF
jgi:DNA modification methylase/ParB-like chromosome segregation protein Spo0J